MDVVACRADWLYHQGQFQECFALTSGMLVRDPYATEHLPLHLAAALELRQKNELFLRAHKYAVVSVGVVNDICRIGSVDHVWIPCFVVFFMPFCLPYTSSQAGVDAP